jgi:hypothetical protein
MAKRVAWVAWVMWLLVSTGARAEYLGTPRVTDTYLGYSAKYKQFAVRRELSFTLTSQGRELPGVNVEQPEMMVASLPVTPGFTCTSFCASRGLKCSTTEKGDYRKHSVSPMPAGYTYRADDCDEALVDRFIALAKAGKTMGRRAADIAQVSCYCQKSQQAHSFTNFPNVVTITLVEVYESSGSLKRTFLEDTTQAAMLATLKGDLQPIPKEVRGYFERELVVTAGLLATHLREGGFEVARPTGKHPGGKCVVVLADPGKVESAEDADLFRTVNLGVATPQGTVPIFAEEMSADRVTFDAWWMPGRPAVLAGILKAPQNYHREGHVSDVSRLYVVPASQLAGCE